MLVLKIFPWLFVSRWVEPNFFAVISITLSSPATLFSLIPLNLWGPSRGWWPKPRRVNGARKVPGSGYPSRAFPGNTCSGVLIGLNYPDCSSRSKNLSSMPSGKMSSFSLPTKMVPAWYLLSDFLKYSSSPPHPKYITFLSSKDWEHGHQQPVSALFSAVSAPCAWKGPLLKGDACGTSVPVSVCPPCLRFWSSRC